MIHSYDMRVLVHSHPRARRPSPAPPPRDAGVVLPLLSQTIMFWQVLLAYVLLRKRLR